MHLQDLAAQVLRQIPPSEQWRAIPVLIYDADTDEYFALRHAHYDDGEVFLTIGEYVRGEGK